jgi:DNA-binding MarR family transcriptional regulator
MTAIARTRPSAAPHDDAVSEVAAGLRLAVTRLARRMRQQSDTGISVSLLSALSAIERSGRITMSDLAAVERVQRPTMTRIAAGLEEAGLAVREPDPDDGRVARLSATAEGRRLLDRSRRRKNAYLARKLRGFSPDDLHAVERALPLLERLMEEAE